MGIINSMAIARFRTYISQCGEVGTFNTNFVVLFHAKIMQYQGRVMVLVCSLIGSTSAAAKCMYDTWSTNKHTTWF